MTRRLLPCLGAAVVLGCWALAVAATDAPDGKPVVAAADDVQDVVLLADERPVLLRLHIEVDGTPFRSLHREALDAYLAALFAQLDSDNDGFLSEAEARRMPAPFKPPSDPTLGAVNVAFNYRVVDADGDGRISRACGAFRVDSIRASVSSQADREGSGARPTANRRRNRRWVSSSARASSSVASQASTRLRSAGPSSPST